MGLELVIGIAVGALVIGAMLGYFLPLGGAKKARVAELEAALETAQEELADYKREVYGEFAETAEKFRALDKSYHELHQQLAKSSVTLCGDAATPLLESQGQDTQALAAEEIVVAESSPEDVAPPQTEVAQAEADAQFSDAVDEAAPQDTNADDSARAAEDTELQTPQAEQTATAEVDSVELGETGEVPTLTEVDADTAAPRRESA